MTSNHFTRRPTLRLILLLALCLPLTAWATDKPKTPTHEPQHQNQAQDQAQEQGQSQSASSDQNQTQSQGNTQTIESRYQAPSTFISTPGSTAPCVIANGWSVGVPGAGGGRNKSRVDPACWAEYVKQAEHQRSMDEARLALERDKLAFQREQIQTRQQCSDVANRVLTACNAGEK